MTSRMRYWYGGTLFHHVVTVSKFSNMSLALDFLLTGCSMFDDNSVKFISVTPSSSDLVVMKKWSCPLLPMEIDSTFPWQSSRPIFIWMSMGSFPIYNRAHWFRGALGPLSPSIHQPWDLNSYEARAAFLFRLNFLSTVAMFLACTLNINNNTWIS
jgi:hypothetical protein